ncbi:hypothetical protein [Chelativorans sp.]|uniref:hypothetical protein n=1 Tax=Chelativorans sp. TaxID=2203393 RepID=UPI002811B0C7|nr:hypothetical protein [Chelativorans sp.]
MAEIDRASFSEAVVRKLSGLGLTFGGAVERWPMLDKAMLHRACVETPLSAGNFLLLCEALQLDPYGFLKREKRKQVRLRDIARRLEKQAVTQKEQRETWERRP